MTKFFTTSTFRSNLSDLLKIRKNVYAGIEKEIYIEFINCPIETVECLDYAIGICKDKSFAELTEFSHDLAWNNTQRDRTMSVKDILREVGDDEAYVDYIADNLKLINYFCDSSRLA